MTSRDTWGGHNLEITWKKELEDCGIDVDSGIRAHMGNEAMFVKVLKLVVTDEKFDNFFESADTEDADEIFEISHSLKGTVGNVGLCKMDQLISEVCETTRRGSMDGVRSKIREVKQIHNEILQHVM